MGMELSRVYRQDIPELFYATYEGVNINGTLWKYMFDKISVINRFVIYDTEPCKFFFRDSGNELYDHHGLKIFQWMVRNNIDKFDNKTDNPKKS